MLNTKYQSSTLFSLRQEQFWSSSSLVLYSNLWTLGWGQFLPQGHHKNNLVEVYKDMLHDKYQSSMPSSFREEEIRRWASLFLCSKLWPPGPGQFRPRGHHMNKLYTGSQGMLYTKCKNCRPSSFKEKEFKNFFLLFLCSNLWPLGRGQFWPQGHRMSKLGRGLQEDATYQILKL